MTAIHTTRLGPGLLIRWFTGGRAILEASGRTADAIHTKARRTHTCPQRVMRRLLREIAAEIP